MSSGGAYAIPDRSLESRMIALTSSFMDVLTDETTTSTSYTNLSTSGPAITLSSSVTQPHELHINAWMWTSSAGQNVLMSPSVAGNTAIDENAAFTDGGSTAISSVGRTILASTVGSGSTHTAKYKVGASTGEYSDRRLTGKAI